MIKKILLGLLALVVIIIFIGLIKMIPPKYTYTNKKLPSTFQAFYKSKLEESKKLNVRPRNEELLVRNVKGKSKYAILYVHGFKASRLEGQYLVDKIAKKLNANVYYMRLPGHGTNMEDHANATFDRYLTDAIDATRMMNKLGKKVIIMGTSTGGLLATYIGAKYKDLVSGVVLVSPFYNFASPVNRLLSFYPLFKLMTYLKPVVVDNDPIKNPKDNWTMVWYKKIYIRSLANLLDLTDFVKKDEIIQEVTVPTMMIYYYKDEKHQDSTASVKEMKEVYVKIGGKNKNSLNRVLEVKQGQHVLLSKYYDTERSKIVNGTVNFIKQIK